MITSGPTTPPFLPRPMVLAVGIIGANEIAAPTLVNTVRGLMAVVTMVQHWTARQRILTPYPQPCFELRPLTSNMSVRAYTMLKYGQI